MDQYACQSYSRSDNSHRIHNICFTHLVLQQKYLQYWCYFSSVFVFDIHKIRIWSFHTMALEGRKCRHELAVHVNLRPFLLQLQKDFLYPTTYILYSTSFSTRLARETESGLSHMADVYRPGGAERGAGWHVHGHAHSRRRRPRRDGCGESELCEVQKRGNESRSEGMARTAWHLNRGFPPCTLSSLRSFCLHKDRLFTHSAYQSARVLRILSVKKQKTTC